MQRAATIILCTTLALAGCRSAPKPVERMPGAVMRSSVVPQPATRGLEMYWWGFDDGGDPAALARKLRPYLANSAPISARTQRDWRANGLRMVSLLMQDLPRYGFRMGQV